MNVSLTPELDRAEQDLDVIDASIVDTFLGIMV